MATAAWPANRLNSSRSAEVNGACSAGRRTVMTPTSRSRCRSGWEIRAIGGPSPDPDGGLACVAVRDDPLASLGADASEPLTQLEAALREPGAEAGPGARHEGVFGLVPEDHRAADRADEAGRPVHDHLQQGVQVELAADLLRDILERFDPAGPFGKRVLGLLAGADLRFEALDGRLERGGARLDAPFKIEVELLDLLSSQLTLDGAFGEAGPKIVEGGGDERDLGDRAFRERCMLLAVGQVAHGAGKLDQRPGQDGRGGNGRAHRDDEDRQQEEERFVSALTGAHQHPAAGCSTTTPQPRRSLVAYPARISPVGPL